MIEVSNLKKKYGNVTAVENLSFTIDKGQIYGFLGPNGAGKSTTMNIMTGCLAATDGTVRIDGFDIFEEPTEAKRKIGYLPEHPPLYPNETPVEYLRFVGEAKGLRRDALYRQINDVIKQTGLNGMENRLISALSKGYKQRVGIAQALLGNPEVIILDEPTVGLDPLQIIEIRDLIRRLGQTHTVIFSSHILSEVQEICEQVLIISKGNLVAFNTPGNLETLLTTSAGIWISAYADKEGISSLLNRMAGIGEYEITENGDKTISLHITSEEKDTRSLCCQLFFSFAEQNIPIFEMTSGKATLEDVFIELTENEADMEKTAKTAVEVPADKGSNETAEDAGLSESEDVSDDSSFKA